jgi:hypothetical protein
VLGRQFSRKTALSFSSWTCNIILRKLQYILIETRENPRQGLGRIPDSILDASRRRGLVITKHLVNTITILTHIWPISAALFYTIRHSTSWQIQPFNQNDISMINNLETFEFSFPRSFLDRSWTSRQAD